MSACSRQSKALSLFYETLPTQHSVSSERNVLLFCFVLFQIKGQDSRKALDLPNPVTCNMGLNLKMVIITSAFSCYWNNQMGSVPRPMRYQPWAIGQCQFLCSFSYSSRLSLSWSHLDAKELSPLTWKELLSQRTIDGESPEPRVPQMCGYASGLQVFLF